MMKELRKNKGYSDDRKFKMYRMQSIEKREKST